MKRLWIAGTLALLVAAGTLGTLPAQASTSGRRNTAIGLGAAAVYELLNGNTTAGVALGAGAAYGYKRYQDEKRYEDRYGYYGRRSGYRSDRYDGDYRPARHEEYRRGNDGSYRGDGYNPDDRYSRSDRHRGR